MRKLQTLYKQLGEKEAEIAKLKEAVKRLNIEKKILLAKIELEDKKWG